MTHLECSRTGARYDADVLQNLSEVGAPLLVRYDLDRAGHALDRTALSTRPPTMWRYREVMPIRTPEEIVSLGEGFTPLLYPERLGAGRAFPALHQRRIAQSHRLLQGARPLGCRHLRPRARREKAGHSHGGQCRWRDGGLCGCLWPAGDSLYAPRYAAGLCRRVPVCGAEVELVDGLISDCGRIVGERKEAEGWFEVSTLKEPYRIGG